MNKYNGDTISKFKHEIQNEIRNEIRNKTDFSIVREKNYFQDFLYFLVPYSERKDLTSAEKVEIGNYQDIHPWNIQKQDWSIPIPDNWKEKSCCFVLNSYCRFPEFSKSVTADEEEIIMNCLQNIDSAISKSHLRLENEIFIHRGVFDDKWLLNPHIGQVFTEKAVGSFSLDVQQAYNYINQEKPILFRLKLTKEMNALYIDDSEYEVLLPRNSIYIITGIHEE